IHGKVVDKYGQPVAHAQIAVTATSNDTGGDFVYGAEADDNGQFQFQNNDSHLIKNDRILFATGPEPPNAVCPIQAPFDNLSNLKDESYTGHLISINKNGEVNIGEIPAQIFYGTIRVSLTNSSSKPAIIDLKDWLYVWMRIRNEQGQTVIERSLSKSEIT